MPERTLTQPRSVRLPEWLEDALTEHSRRTTISKGAIIRQALMEYLDIEPPEAR